MITNIKNFAIAACLALTSASSLAAPTVYFGENQNPGGSVSGDPATARAEFLSQLTGVGSEGFESFEANASPPPRVASFVGSSGNVTATLSGGSIGVVDASLDTGFGRFNTTPGGSKWWLADTGLTIDFDTPVAAFGFYGTDIGDFAGQLTVTLTSVASEISTLTVPHTISGADGSLLFWGFVDTSTQYTRVSFGNTAAGFDGFGFDDFVVGDVGQIRPPPPLPEPGILPLVLAGLGLAAIARRRRRR